MHRVIQTHIEEYLDGTLGAHDRREVEGHLHTCRECATEINEARRTHEWMELLIAPPAAPGPNFYARLRMGIEAEKEQRVGFLPTLFPVLGRQLNTAFVLLLLLLSGFLLGVYHNERQNAAAIIMQSKAQTEAPLLSGDNQMNRERVMRAIVAPVSAEGD